MFYPINCNHSKSVWTMKANPLTGTVIVRWFSNCTMEYTYKASRREIMGLLWNSKQSLGQWINWHCLVA